MSHIVEVEKLIERVAADQILDYFLANNLLHLDLHGGLPNLDPTTAIIHYQEVMLEAANRGEVGAAILVDQSVVYI